MTTQCQKYKRNSLFIVLCKIFIFLNGFVWFEPALADFMFFIFIMYYLINVKASISLKYILIGLLLVCCSAVPFMVSAFYFNNNNYRFLIIDIYLWVFFVIELDIIKRYSIQLDEIIKPWLLAALITIISYGIALIKKDNTVMGVEVIRFGWRLTGFFKDPNVCAPFLAIPTIYYFNSVLEKFKLKSFILFSVLFLGVLLCMSRATWLNIFFALLYLYLFQKSKNKIIIFLLGITVVAILFSFITINADIGNLVLSRFGLQTYDTERFTSHYNAINMIFKSPLFGIGTGNYIQFSSIEAHNTYLRLIAEKGLIFGLMQLILFFVPVYFSLKNKNVLLTSMLLGLYINSYFVDTLHWRFLFILFAFALNLNNEDKNKVSHFTSQCSQ